jgi:hypothetical protein
MNDFDFSLPTLINITCRDVCILCAIGYQENEKINMYQCDLHICEKHFKMITKNSISIRHSKQVGALNDYPET